MSETKPWSPGEPVWALPGNDSVREDFEERAAIIEFHGGHSRGGAELFAYAMVVERALGEDRLTYTAQFETNVAVQLDRMKRLRNHWAKGYVA